MVFADHVTSMKQRNECMEECGGKILKVKQLGKPRSRLENNINFKNRTSHMQDGPTATLQMLHFIYCFQQI
jgi:hypothetical protein